MGAPRAINISSACETPNSLGARRAPENARQRKPPLTRAASRAHRDARRLSHIPLASLSIFYHPFTMSRDSLHSLYDVPGTGFRDREDGPMYSQYHKIGWQADWKPKDNPDNRYYMCNNPVVIDNIPASVNQAAIAQRARPSARSFACIVYIPRDTRSPSSSSNPTTPPDVWPSRSAWTSRTRARGPPRDRA